MPAVTLGFAQVEERLRRIRSRRNLIALRGSLLIAASNVVLFVAALVAIARRAPEPWFNIALWGGVAVVAAHTIVTALSLQRIWMPLDRMARWVDSAAHLDDRLATLRAESSRLEGSRFTPLLLSQTLALSSRWEPQALIPRTFPRAAIALGISLIALLLTILLVSPRDPTPGEDTPAPSAKRHEAQQPKPPEALAALSNDGSEGADGSPSVGTGPHAFQASDAAPAGRPGGKKIAIREDARNSLPGGTDGKSAAPGSKGDRLPAPEAASDGERDLSNAEKEAMRDAASIKVRRDEKTSADEQGEKSNLKIADASKADKSKPSSDDGQGTNGQGKPQQAGNRNEEGAAGKERSGKEQSSGAAGGARAARDGGGQGQTEMFGEKGAPKAADGHPQTFSLRLSAVLSNAPTEFEPQKRKPVPAAGSGSRAGEVPTTAEAQAPDDPLHKTEVAPEYEEILRRVFDRR